MRDLSDPAVIELTQQILARPEYAGAKSRFARDPIIQKILEWLANLNGLRFSSPVMYWTVFALIGLAMLVLIAHIVWTISIAMRAPVPDMRTKKLAPAANRASARGGRSVTSRVRTQSPESAAWSSCDNH